MRGTHVVMCSRTSCHLRSWEQLEKFLEMSSIDPYNLAWLEPSEHLAVARIPWRRYPAIMNNIMPQAPQVT